MVVRKPDEEGMFEQLQNELAALARQYSLELDDVQQIFLQAGADKHKVKEILAGRSYTSWSELDDLCLSKADTRSREYRALVKEKGFSEVEKRRKYLAEVAA